MFHTCTVRTMTMLASVLLWDGPARVSHAFSASSSSPTSSMRSDSSEITSTTTIGDDDNHHGGDPLAILVKANRNSPFLNSNYNTHQSYRVHLDFGLEPGSFMPKRFPEWGVSGARLGIPVELIFTPNRLDATTDIPDNVQGWLRKGKCNGKNNHHKHSDPEVYQVQVSPTFQSTFVSALGEETVTFEGGGYSMERSMMTSFTDDSTGITCTSPKPRFLLRFWLDCISGAQRNDVKLEPNTRILGTIPIWDNSVVIAELASELDSIKEERRKQQENNTVNTKADDSDKNTISSFLVGLLAGRDSKQQTMETDEASLSYRQEQIERLLPLPGSLIMADKGVTIAPRGSLIMSVPDAKYLIVGAFAMKPGASSKHGVSPTL